MMPTNLYLRFIVTTVICITALTAFCQSNFSNQLSTAALELTKQEVSYDPSYFSIPYPNGDVPPHKGVCTDVVIRAYRKLNIDLQKLVHEDMKAHFDLYPHKWGLTKTDKNIDHRRVPNLMKFFSRFGKTLKNSTLAADYSPGDIIAWDLGGGLLHIGIVVSKKSDDNERYLIVHNIGNGQQVSDCLLQYTVIGHYQYQ
ncbi:MAG TPA: DUF1287 domain-containing protein [Cyclobacteriaceae bacterium]